MSTVDIAAGDPDGMDAATMALVSEAVGLLKRATVPREEAVAAVVQRVKVEAVFGAVAGTIFGSFARVAGAAPDLLGLNDPLGSSTDQQRGHSTEATE